ncbi:MAG: Major Facilitator Superfamily protein [Microgenomates bacterium OLB23]|nr:MAG: Major Facilitator Superfamily protein [Microgenomates bacterium OLB23]
MLFWAIFDGILAYLSPLIITEHGLTKTSMGLLIGSSSVFGALFDMAAAKMLPNTRYRRIFIVMFLLCLAYPFVLYNARVVGVYIAAMAMWGIYYDLKNFGLYNFVGTHIKAKDHVASFGIVQALQGAGYVIAPVIAGIAVAETITWVPFSYALFFLFLAFICFVVLSAQMPAPTQKDLSTKKQAAVSFRTLFSINKIIFPGLLLTFMLYVIDAFFWTIGPLLTEIFSGKHSELILAAYTFPALVVGWVVGKITTHVGKKKTAFMSLLLGSLLLMSFVFVAYDFLLTLGVVFFAGIFFSLSMPAVNGVYADVIKENSNHEKEVEVLTDFYTNLGYVFGPAAAGFIADTMGIAAALSVVGFIGFCTAIILILITPLHITIPREL